jgi:hypothetical protein
MIIFWDVMSCSSVSRQQLKPAASVFRVEEQRQVPPREELNKVRTQQMPSASPQLQNQCLE